MIVMLARRMLLVLVLVAALATLTVALVLTTRPQVLPLAQVDDTVAATIWNVDAPIYASNPQGWGCALTGCPRVKTSGPSGHPVKVICRDRSYMKLAGARPSWIFAGDLDVAAVRACDWIET